MTKFSATDADAIRGLMLLGRTREQAEREIKRARERELAEAERELWDMHDEVRR